MTVRTSRRRFRDEAGMSLPEVIVYIAVSVIVLVGLVAMFASAMSAQAKTRDRDAATGSVSVAISSLQASIRNSSAFDISGSVLRARVAVGDGSEWECRGWSLSAGTLYYKASSGAITSPLNHGSEGWTELVISVSGTMEGPSGGNVPFRRSGTQLLYGLEVLVGDAGTEVVLEGGSVPQAAGAGSPTACW